MRNLGFKGRLITLCVLLVLGTVGILSTVLIWGSYNNAIQKESTHALIYARLVAGHAEPSVLLNDAKSLQRIVQVASEESDIQIAQVIDISGKILADFHRQTPYVPEVEINLKQPLPGEINHDASRVELTATQLLVVVPIWPHSDTIDLGIVIEDEDAACDHQDHVGFIRLTYSLDATHAQMLADVFQSIAISVVVVLLGVGITVFVARRLVAPVHDLARTASAIADGDLSHRATEQAAGEIGTLARVFNQMADSLAAYTDNLETQVHERTAELQARTEALDAEIIIRKQTETELKYAKEAAEAAAREMEEINHELEEAVQQASQMAATAEIANNAKSEFLANMSHEIRTPMTSILGFAETLMDPTLNGEERLSAVGTIKRNGDHLLAVINDILDITKIEAGKMEVTHEICSPFQVVADVQSLMQVRAEAKNLTLKVDYIGDLPETIQTDTVRLRQILINLVGNAIKFTELGEIRLVIQFADTGIESSIQFEVIDTGIGMAQDEMAQLFEPFSQVDSSLTRRHGGAGLGLSISRRLARMLGGDLTVDSAQDLGSMFRLTVATGPLDGVEMVDGPSNAIIIKDGRPVGTALDLEAEKLDARILLAEDGPDNQRLIAFMLRKAGADVTVAENGKIAFDLALAKCDEGWPFDVILMDMQMPVLDGYAAVSQLRLNGYDGPIIALTAHAMAGDREKCLNAGCDGFETKPIDRIRLIDTIKSWLGKHSERVSPEYTQAEASALDV